MSDPPYIATEVDAAVNALREPERLSHAPEIVTHAAPSLQGVLAAAPRQGGWFSQAHEPQASRALLESNERERLPAVSRIMAEETRLDMLVGVAVGSSSLTSSGERVRTPEQTVTAETCLYAKTSTDRK